MLNSETLPLRQNFSFRRLLHNLKRLDKINSQDIEAIYRVFDEAGARFPMLEVQQLRELEVSLIELLSAADEHIERSMWRYRGRFSRTHEMAVTHIRIDIYADEFNRGLAVRVIQACLMTQAEQ